MRVNTSQYDVIIVGAGASGLICALECARAQKRVLVLEKGPLLGRKISVSGNGRCNFTNRYVSPPFYHADEKLISAVLAQFSHEDCLHYFDRLGVFYTEESNGRFFPATGKATAITDAFKIALEENSVDVLYNAEVCRIKRGSLFTVCTQTQAFQAPRVVLACGSCAYSQVSGSQRGYELAQSLGHRIVPPQAALSGLVLKENFSRLTGIRTDVKVTVLSPEHPQAEGEIIFTAYGINGPAALNVSSAISRALKNGPVNLSLNFLPHLKNAPILLQQRFEQFSHRKPKDFFAGLLHESLTNLLIDFKGLRKNKPMVEQLPSVVKNTFDTLTSWPATVLSLRPWNEAMVATGGVNVREINYNSFESLRCPHLYITGELLDVDGQSGGFNLHFAWASGICAARAIIKE